MQFLVVGFDGKDDDAAARRQQARSAHLELGDQLLASGHLWYAAEIENADGDAIGSMRLVDFASEAELQEWLAREPYVTSDVWRSMHKHACTVRDPWQFSRPETFFETR
jgi:uncharacterized protein YciI